MDRRTLLERLDAVRAGSDDLDLPEMEGVAQSLAEDSSLKEEFLRRESLDRVLAAAMHDVPVPPDLKSRILTRLADSDATPSREVPIRRHNWRRSVAIVLSVAASLLFAAILWIVRPSGSEPIAVAQLQSSAAVLLQSSDEAAPFNGAFDPKLPSSVWHRLRITSRPIGLLLEDGQHRAAAWTFSFGNSRGVLVAIPATDVASPPTESYEYQGGNAITWTANGFVYVCQVEGSIDSLLRQLDEGHLA